MIPSKEAIHLEQILVFGFLLHRHTFIGSNAGPWESAFVEFDETVLKEERSSCAQVSDNEKWELNAPARPRCRPHGPVPTFVRIHRTVAVGASERGLEWKTN